MHLCTMQVTIDQGQVSISGLQHRLLCGRLPTWSWTITPVQPWEET